MRRRQFLTLLGSVAAWPVAAWPVAARAQQGAEMRRVAVLMSGDEAEPGYHGQLAAFVQGLRGLGWTDGQNIRLDVRWNGGDAARARSFATELLRLSPDVWRAATLSSNIGSLAMTS